MSRVLTATVLLAVLAACALSDRSARSEDQLRMNTNTSATTFTMPSDTEIAIRRTFDAPRARVWDAWTSCEHLQNWLLGPPGWTMYICEVDIRAGGAHRLAWRGPEGAELEIRGTYREVSKPERLVVVESWGGDWPDTMNSLRFIEENGKTRTSITIRYPSHEAREAALATGMKDGMSHTFDRLAEYLATLR